MFIKKLDMLSPPITLYFKGENQHSSIFGGILSFIAYTLVFIAGVYYALEFINKENPKAYFFNRYVIDAGTFPVNSSSMFNFIQIADTNKNEEIPFDFSVFRAIGLDDVVYEDYYLNPNIVEEKDHWIYGYCNNNSDTEGISYLIHFNYYEQSACIRKFYDKNKKKYFNTGEEGFRWPIIEKGCSNPNRTYYGIILQRCDKVPELVKSQGFECKSDSYISDYIDKVSLKFQIIDHYADMLNYKMPFTKYFYEVTSAIRNGVFIINHLNFNPANMLTHNGIFFDNQVQERSYFFTQNEKHTVDQTILKEGQSTNGCLIGIYFWMQNTLQYYERNYDRLQDVLSDIGGISSIVVTLAYFINILVNYYIILLDTEDFVLNTEHENFIKKDISKRPTIFRKAREILYPPRRNYGAGGRNSFIDEQQDQQSSNYQRLMKDGVDIYQVYNQKDEKIEKEEPYLNIYLKRNNILKNYYKSKGENKEGNSELNQSKNKKIYIRRANQTYNMRKTPQIRNSVNFQRESFLKSSNNRNSLYLRNSRLIKKEISENPEDNNKQLIQKQNFTWIRYFWYFICCCKNDKKIEYYESFREKLISEENLIQNYLDIYGLLKLNNIPRKSLLDKESEN